MKIQFSSRELRDFMVAWLVLGVAFALFLRRSIAFALVSGSFYLLGEFIRVFLRSLLTVGVGFLLHELAHKLVAIRFGQLAEFRADYGMLGLALVSALAGFLFAAPGAVHHRGYITPRENGLIALAGPVTNLGLAVLFLPLMWLPGFIGAVGVLGVLINLFLAAFNMLPFGPLDGRKVFDWNKPVYFIVFLPSVAVLVLFFFA